MNNSRSRLILKKAQEAFAGMYNIEYKIYKYKIENINSIKINIFRATKRNQKK